MKTDATYTLNFLIYIQNIYLNQNRIEETGKFPYLPSKFVFKEEFEIKYKELWDEILQKISNPHNIDMKIFYEEKDLFYQRLFVISSDGLKKYNEIYKSFQVWWDSFAGRFSVERSVDGMGDNLYIDLANLLKEKGITPEKPLNISLIYDECQLANATISFYFAVLPVRDFFVKYKEMVLGLTGAFGNN